MSEEKRRASALGVLVWLVVVALVGLGSVWLFATRTAPVSEWAFRYVGHTATLVVMLGVAGLICLLFPAVLTWRITRNLRQRKLEPRPRAIFSGIFILANLVLATASAFIGSASPGEMLQARGLWLPSQLLGPESGVVQRLSDWTGVPTHVGEDQTADSAPDVTPDSPTTPVKSGETPAAAGQGADCLDAATAMLKKHDPAGFAFVEKNGNEPSIATWIDCDDPTYRLSAAVHETVHVVDFKSSMVGDVAFHTTADDNVTMPRTKYFPRSEIAAYLPKDAKYRETYLEGTSGEQDLVSLLSELNAYTHGLATNGKLAYFIPRNRKISSRDGLATQMLYLELYVRRAKEAHPDDWRHMATDDQTLTVIQTLWSQAEETLVATLPDERLGIDDGPILKRVYQPTQVEQLVALFRHGGRTFEYDRSLAR